MPMSMTPDQYFDAFVRGNYEEFANDPGCVRRAFNAVVAASHQADHCFQYYKKFYPSKVNSFGTIGNYVEFLSISTNGSFRDVRSIANAYKHLYTGNNSKHAEESSISSAGTIESVRFSNSGVVELAQQTSDDTDSVIYTTKAGERRCLKTALDVVFRFWENQFLRE